MGDLIQFPKMDHLPLLSAEPAKPITDPIYVVTRDDWDKPGKKHILGYARGDPAIIRAFYTDKRYNNVTIRETEVRDITPEMLDKKQWHQARKAMLLKELGQLERKLTED